MKKKKKYNKGGNIEEELYIADLPEVEVTAKRRVNSSVDFSSFVPSKVPEKIKQFQVSQGLTPDGIWGKESQKAFALEQGYKVSDKAAKKRAGYQLSVKKAASNITSKSPFRMDPKVEKDIVASGNDPKQCIGSVCTFLRDKVGQGFKSSEGIYYSNFTFEQKAKEEGWSHYQDFSIDKPDVGDILEARQESAATGRTRHAMLVTDYNPDTKEYRILDNTGSAQNARVRTFNEEQFNTWGQRNNVGFYRKTNFDGEELYSGSLPKPDFLKEEHENIPVEVTDIKTLNIEHRDYILGLNEAIKSGVNNKEYNDIPQEDLERIAAISAAIPYNESEFGKGIGYKVEKAIPGIAKLGRDILRGKSSRELSIGLSQISSSMLPEHIKSKYFKGMSDRKITKQLAKNADISGKVTFDLMVDKYRQQQKNPAYYADNQDRFWEALIYRHKSPNFAKTQSGKERLENLDLSYVNNIYENMKNIRTRKQSYKDGGFLTFLEATAPLLNLALPGAGTAVGAVAGMANQEEAPSTYQPLTAASNKHGFAKGGQLQQLSSTGAQVQANNPSRTDSVELDNAFVDHNEVLSNMPDGSTYVFPDDTINPLTNNPFSKDAKQLHATNKRLEGQDDKISRRGIEMNNELLSKYAAVNEIIRTVNESGLKPKLEEGGPIAWIKSKVAGFQNNQMNYKQNIERHNNAIQNLRPIAHQTRVDSFNTNMELGKQFPESELTNDFFRMQGNTAAPMLDDSNTNYGSKLRIEKGGYMKNSYNEGGVLPDNVPSAELFQHHANSQGAALKVDNVWGPQTQAAWEQYGNTFNPSPLPTVGGAIEGFENSRTPRLSPLPQQNVMSGGMAAFQRSQQPTDLGVPTGQATPPPTPPPPSIEDLYTKSPLGEGLQYAALAGQAGLIAQPTARQDLYQNTSPINVRQFDSSAARQQLGRATNTANLQARNSTSRAQMMGNLQQVTSNRMQSENQITDRFNQLNKQSQTQYEGLRGQREAQNISARYATDQMNDQNKAAHRAGLSALIGSVSNLGQAKVSQSENQASVNMLMRAFPDIAKFFIQENKTG